MKIRFTPSAKYQFLSALTYIREDDPLAARRFSDKAKKTVSRLETFPESGRKLPEFPDFPHREVIVPPYRFFYRIQGETVWIVAVWHGSQIPEEPAG